MSEPLLDQLRNVESAINSLRALRKNIVKQLTLVNVRWQELVFINETEAITLCAKQENTGLIEAQRKVKQYMNVTIPPATV
jgi:hypothetical protein